MRGRKPKPTHLKLLEGIGSRVLAAFCQAYGRLVEAKRKLHEAQCC
jgi:hypothetical protein